MVSKDAAKCIHGSPQLFCPENLAGFGTSSRLLEPGKLRSPNPSPRRARTACSHSRLWKGSPLISSWDSSKMYFGSMKSTRKNFTLSDGQIFEAEVSNQKQASADATGSRLQHNRRRPGNSVGTRELSCEASIMEDPKIRRPWVSSSWRMLQIPGTSLQLDEKWQAEYSKISQLDEFTSHFSDFSSWRSLWIMGNWT